MKGEEKHLPVTFLPPSWHLPSTFLSPSIQVGQPPKAEALNIFLMRLREQGWNLEPTIKRIMECGGNLDPHVQGVVRLICQTQDAEKLGHIVWAKDPSRDVGQWWPAEALDPFNLPPGVNLTLPQV